MQASFRFLKCIRSFLDAELLKVLRVYAMEKQASLMRQFMNAEIQKPFSFKNFHSCAKISIKTHCISEKILAVFLNSSHWF